MKINTEKTYTWSKFVHIFKKDGVICLVHSLTMHKVYGDRILEILYEQSFRTPTQITSAIKQLQTQYSYEVIELVIHDLVNKNLLVEDNEADRQLYTELFLRGLNLYTIKHMYFLPTNFCNFRCKYCFIEDDGRPIHPVKMTEEIAKKGIDIFAKLTENSNEISMTFYGGEPLLNAEIVYFTMRYVRTLEKEGKFKQPVRMALITNGSLVDEKTIEVIHEVGANISISIDGPEHFHNLSRIDTEGMKTFDTVTDAFNRLVDAGIRPGVSCTLNESNIDCIDEITTFIIDQLKPNGMGFNILLPRVHHSTHLKNYSYEFAAGQLIKAFTKLRENGIYEDRMMRRIRPYISGGFHLKDCMGVGGQIVITPDGKIGPCQAFLGYDEFFPLRVEDLHTRLAELDSNELYKNPLFDEWKHRFPLNMKECSDCCAISVCGGGCPYAAYVNHGSVWEIDERVCAQAKNIFEWMIWDTFDHFSEDPEQKELNA
ncbi:MAG: radical SAM protein [Bacillota bacterium]|nr:radical SAM protein [Bacillota bacterium]